MSLFTLNKTSGDSCVSDLLISRLIRFLINIEYTQHIDKINGKFNVTYGKFCNFPYINKLPTSIQALEPNLRQFRLHLRIHGVNLPLPKISITLFICVKQTQCSSFILVLVVNSDFQHIYWQYFQYIKHRHECCHIGEKRIHWCNSIYSAEFLIFAIV